MLGLTPLGTFHTAISLIAVVAGFVALAGAREISTRSAAGLTFFGGTVISCLTAFGIFQHGGFGVPHVFAIVTLVVLAVALAAERAGAFARLSRYVATVGYSFALFLHFVPATVETLLRLPAGAPYLAHPEDPKAQPIIGFFFLLFLIGATLQVRRIRAAGARL
ncbi:MAG TPA: hypothetical protein VLF42_03675 [Burkholderiales bacterium]|nr:hypothetical protein [Burkholderiales bacterium]